MELLVRGRRLPPIAPAGTPGGRPLLAGLLLLVVLAPAGCSRADDLRSGEAAGQAATTSAEATGEDPADAVATAAETLRDAEQERLQAQDDALLAAAAEAERREDLARQEREERELRERVDRLRRKREEIRRRYLDWHSVYRRELAALLDARSRLSGALRTRSLATAEAPCRELLERARSVDRKALLAAPDRRVNEALEEILDGYQRGAAACAERSSVVAWTLLTTADEKWAEVHRWIEPWVR